MRTEAQEEQHVKMKTETGTMHLEAKRRRRLMVTTKSQEEARTDSSPQVSEEA